MLTNMNWKTHFETFDKSDQTIGDFGAMIVRMGLFAKWSRLYWIRYMWKHKDQSPLELLQDHPFLSFFFGREQNVLMTLNIWGSVHMSFFLLKNRLYDAEAFMRTNQYEMSQSFFHRIRPWLYSQGDWKCEICTNTVDGSVHICPFCKVPIKDWTKLLKHGTSQRASQTASETNRPDTQAVGECD